MQAINLSETRYSIIFLLLFQVGQAQNESFTMSQIGANNLLTTPWDLHYGPDGFLWITEREEGVIVRINPETAERDLLVDIPDVFSSSGQDGLLGMVLHDSILESVPYLYCSYSYITNDERKQKIVRFTYTNNEGDGTLAEPMIVIENLPASNDHNSGRLVFGPDGKLYYTIGDQGGNQNRNYCNPILSQVLPSQAEIDAGDWSNYPGKILRLNTDGSIPDDNPVLAGVQSHIYSYGHRNPQGIVFSSSGALYADEHGPNTDDEVNKIESGRNYGWPNVVGFQDDQAYDYCNWSTLPNCLSVDYQNGTCPSPAELAEESTFMDDRYKEPIFSMFAVTDDYDYNNPACENSWICRPNVAPSSIGIYESEAIPGWQRSLLVTSLKRGRVYRLQLDEEGNGVVGDTMQLFYTANRYRDIAMDPDGKSFYLITDQGGRTSDASGLNDTRNLRNPGAILKFTLNESTAVADQLSQTPFQIWPNPATNTIHIEVSNQGEQNITGQLMNASGQIVQRFNKLSVGVNERTIAAVPAGIYFLKLSSDRGSYQKRLVVQ